MLTVNYVDDDDELMRIYDRAGVTGANTSGINAVLFDDDEGVGVCKWCFATKGSLLYLSTSQRTRRKIRLFPTSFSGRFFSNCR